MNKNVEALYQKAEGVVCPSCGTTMDIEEILAAQIEQRIMSKYAERHKRSQVALEKKMQELERERLDVKQLSAQTWEIIQEKLKHEKIRLAKEMDARYQVAQDEGQRELLAELERQKQENLALKQVELKLMQKESELERVKQEEEIEFEKESLRRQREIESRWRKQMDEKLELLKTEYEKRLDDQKKLVDTMGQKIEQGSMKMQGEVQELAIEAHLKQVYPMDDIEPVKSGVRGGDCIQFVRTSNRVVAGSIYFESKRTKAWQQAWITKFKQDMIRHKAEVGVLVTQTMPPNTDEITQIEGIWVCTFSHFKQLVPVLRAFLLRLHNVGKQLDNSQDKMSLLYNYLVSTEFRLQVESIIKGFSTLREDLDKEKRAMHSIWKKREKQLERVILSTASMYGSMQGLAGGDIQEIEALQFQNFKGIS